MVWVVEGRDMMNFSETKKQNDRRVSKIGITGHNVRYELCIQYL